jgi:hypothetical protein
MSCRKFLFPGGPVSVSSLLLGFLFCLSLKRLFVRKKEISFVIFYVLLEDVFAAGMRESSLAI